MTVVDPDVLSQPAHVVNDLPADRPATRLCPYLAAAGGAWRSSTVAREHRCNAVMPPAPLAAEKQRRLCLTADYPACATYEAARAARPLASVREQRLPRPLARTMPIVLDHGRLAIAVPALHSDRSSGQAVLIVLLAIALVAVVLAKVAGGAPAGVLVVATPHPTVRPSVGPSLRATTAPTAGSTSDLVIPASPIASASSLPAESPRPTKAPASRTYTVKAGDTVTGIAARFGTTTRAIASLNGLANVSNLRIGQVLKIP